MGVVGTGGRELVEADIRGGDGASPPPDVFAHHSERRARCLPRTPSATGSFSRGRLLYSSEEQAGVRPGRFALSARWCRAGAEVGLAIVPPHRYRTSPTFLRQRRLSSLSLVPEGRTRHGDGGKHERERYRRALDSSVLSRVRLGEGACTAFKSYRVSPRVFGGGSDPLVVCGAAPGQVCAPHCFPMRGSLPHPLWASTSRIACRPRPHALGMCHEPPMSPCGSTCVCVWRCWCRAIFPPLQIVVGGDPFYTWHCQGLVLIRRTASLRQAACRSCLVGYPPLGAIPVEVNTPHIRATCVVVISAFEAQPDAVVPGIICADIVAMRPRR